MSLMSFIQTDDDEEQPDPGKKYYGKYRGTVISNVDPMAMGRITVMVSDVSSLLPTTWAMPCLPGTGLQQGVYALPLPGSGVWIEFEQGDPDFPIWVGGYWGPGEVPTSALLAPPTPPVVIQSVAKNRLIISGTPGEGINLETTAGPAGPTIILSPEGIMLKDGVGGSISIAGGTIMINNTSLIVSQG